MLVKWACFSVLFKCSFFSAISAEQLNVFVVYPLQLRNSNSLKHPISHSEVRLADLKKKRDNETSVHVIYPATEELFIMTPTPTAENPSLYYTETPEEIKGKFMATTEAVDTTTQYLNTDASIDADGSTMFFEETTMYPTSTALSYTTVSTTTDLAPVGEISSPLYDETGPIKLSRKRMFGYGKSNRKYIPGLYTSVQKEISTVLPSSSLTKPYKSKRKKGKRVLSQNMRFKTIKQI